MGTVDNTRVFDYTDDYQVLGGVWLWDKQRLGVSCVYCGSDDTWAGWKLELRAKELGTFSLAGVQMKMSVKQVKHPWALCKGCGHESRGRLG